ncbi:MAG: HDOD domain-containing protein [Desulfobacteraceae bacterium]|nr:HDOD domain-containing protein [Desulfobacteraceae bacterium]
MPAAQEVSRRDYLISFADRLAQEDMPIFSATAKTITSISGSETSSMTDLTIGILKDPSLTAKVLRLANSIHYSQGGRVSTISRAVMQLGFDAVKSICLSAAIIEELLKGPRRDKVLLEMSKAFHAATQAKSIAAAKKDPGAEEVFVAALLYRVGHIAFWAYGSKQADELDRAIENRPGEPQEHLEKEVLGFTLDQLSFKLANEWQLGDFLSKSLDAEHKKNPRVQTVLLGHLLAHEASSGRWGSEKFNKLLTGISKYLGTSIEEAGSMVKSNADEAVEMAEKLGFKEFIRFTPYEEQEAKDEEAQPESEAESLFRSPNPLLQLEVLGELNLLLNETPLNLNAFLATLIEGMSRGIGMDRILLGIVNQDRTAIRGRYGLGWESAAIDQFSFSPSPLSQNIFSKVLREKGCIWVKADNMKTHLTTDVRMKVGCDEFFVGPLQLKSRPFGAICADRSLSGRELDDEDFTCFRFFVKAANAVLSSKL